MNGMKIATIVSATMVLAACGNQDSAHLIFGQKINVGLEVSATAPQQGGSLTLGFRSEDLAIVPVAIKKANGDYEIMRAYTKGEEASMAQGGGKLDGGDIRDAFSTLGQFEMDTGKNGTASVGLGKFFATGNAAQRLAEGFKSKLSGESSTESEPRPAPENSSTGTSN